MKKFLTYSAVMLISTLVGCKKEFLEGEPTDSASNTQIEELLKLRPDAGVDVAESYISGAYSSAFSFGNHDDFGIKSYELAMDFMCEDMAMTTANWFVYDYQDDNRSAAYRRPKAVWAKYYKLIKAANDAIPLLKPIDGSEPTDQVASLLGQAYTLRGYSYFMLINLFQHPYQWNKDKPGIPVYTDSSIREERVPVKDVYTLLISDLKNGYELLKGKGTSNKTKLNEYAAAAYLAKALCFVNDYPNQWEEVAKYAELATHGGTLMNGGSFTAGTGLFDGFNSISNPEVLWGSDIDAETNTYWGSFMSNMDPYSGGYGGGVGSYKMISSDLYNSISSNDLRKQWFNSASNAEHAGARYFPKYTQLKFWDVGDFESDYIYLRVAEMYLVQAEALQRSGKETDAKTVLTNFMKTRNSTYSTTASGQALLDEIFLQKRIEMWGEGCRLFDLKRMNLPIDRTKSTNHLAGVPMQISANNLKLIYQIPQNEVDANEKITEADQNP